MRLAIRKSDQRKVVCKFIQRKSVWHWYTDLQGKEIPLEIHVMQLLNQEHHPGFILYLDYFDFGQEFVIVMEYLSEWIDLYDYIEEFGVNHLH